LPAYDWNGETMDSADGFNHIDTYRFSIKDIEAFERAYPELLEVKKEIPEPVSKSNEDLGNKMTATEVATMLGVDVKTVRNRYNELGGMRLGRKLVFFEGSVKDAIQKRTEVGSPSAEGREATGEGVSDKEAGVWLGGPDAAKTRKRLEREDRHGLFR
jgi:hypothetical protein